MRSEATVLAFVVAISWPMNSANAVSCADGLSINSDPAELIICLQEMQEAIKAKTESIPSGAVMAFDRPNGCPDGWAQFSEAAGRFVIGVGGKNELPYVGGEPRYQIGGAETHTLTVAEMPSHSHSFTGKAVSRGGWGGQAIRDFAVGGSEVVSDFKPSGSIGYVGGDGAHNNMPPYIALYFCKNEG